MVLSEACQICDFFNVVDPTMLTITSVHRLHLPHPPTYPPTLPPLMM